MVRRGKCSQSLRKCLLLSPPPYTHALRGPGDHRETTSGIQSASGAVAAVRVVRVCIDLARIGPCTEREGKKQQ